MKHRLKPTAPGRFLEHRTFQIHLVFSVAKYTDIGHVPATTKPGVDVVHDPLVVLELAVPLAPRVVAEVVAERHEEDVRAVQLRLLAVLVEQRPRSETEMGKIKIPHS